MTALQKFGKSALRVTKNYTQGFSNTEIKARNATCNDPWPPSGKEMYELAQLTYNPGDFVEIMQVIDKRLNDKGKNWRHVYKSLVVLDYLLHSGSENVILYCQQNIYEIKTLREFQYIDDVGRDQGSNVRHKAVDIVNLLSDMGRLLRERQVRAHMRDRMTSTSRNSAETESESEGPRPYSRRPLPNGLDRVADQEDEELQRALEESQRIAAQQRATAEDEDLKRALKLSQEDEERRKRLVEQNAMALFDDTNQLSPAPPQQPPIVDASLPLQVAVNAVQPQYTALSPQYTSIQPQYTSYNPYLQQLQQEAMQAEYLRQQTEQQLLQAQQTAAAQQLAFSQQYQQQQQPQPQNLAPQPTGFGSRNPFVAQPPVATATTGQESSLRARISPARDGPVSFNLAGTYEGREPPPQASSRAPDVETRGPAGDVDDVFVRPFSTGGEVPRRHGRAREDARLASLFANYTGDGVDTFGNAGQLRYGPTEFGRVVAQKTGSNNPFLRERASPSSPLRPREQQEEDQHLIDI